MQGGFNNLRQLMNPKLIALAVAVILTVARWHDG
jgi:hypothetical protein